MIYQRKDRQLTRVRAVEILRSRDVSKVKGKNLVPKENTPEEIYEWEVRKMAGEREREGTKSRGNK